MRLMTTANDAEEADGDVLTINEELREHLDAIFRSHPFVMVSRSKTGLMVEGFSDGEKADAEHTAMCRRPGTVSAILYESVLPQ